MFDVFFFCVNMPLYMQAHAGTWSHIALVSSISSYFASQQFSLYQHDLFFFSISWIWKSHFFWQKIHKLHFDMALMIVLALLFSAFWKILMQGPPDTPYEKGVFELYCQFGHEYPVKPPLIRFVTQVSCRNTKKLKYLLHLCFYIVETRKLHVQKHLCSTNKVMLC